VTSFLTVLTCLVAYATGSTLVFGFFARRAPTKYIKNKDYDSAVVAAVFWPFTLIFIVPARLYLERIERLQGEEERRAEEEAAMIKMVDEELAREDRLLAAASVTTPVRLEVVQDPAEPGRYKQREARLNVLVDEARKKTRSGR
jgi:hypothetical protein